MELSTVILALRTGDLEGVINAVPGDDAITDTVACPCGKDNVMVMVRAGCTLLIWDNVSLNHGYGSHEMVVKAFTSEHDAVSEMDRYKAELAQVKGHRQLIAAVGGEGDFMVL
jgi:hypothetical protein